MNIHIKNKHMKRIVKALVIPINKAIYAFFFMKGYVFYKRCKFCGKRVNEYLCKQLGNKNDLVHWYICDNPDCGEMKFIDDPITEKMLRNSMKRNKNEI